MGNSVFALFALTFANLAYALSPFDKAMQYVEQGKWLQAETLLQYQLEIAPSHHRARLELAMVSMQMEQYSQAKENLLTLLEVKELPENVKFNIDVMLEQVSAKRPSAVTLKTKDSEELAPATSSTSPNQNWSASVDFAAGYDSNVRFNFGDYFLEEDPYTDGTYIALTDGSYIFYAPDGNIYDQAGNWLDPDMYNIDLGPREQDTAYVEAKMQLEYERKFDNLDWNTQLLIQNSDNVDFNDFDKLLVKLHSRMTWQLSTNSDFTLDFEHRNLKRGGEKLLTSHAIGFGYNWVANYGTFGLYTQYMERKFYDSQTQRGNLRTLFKGFENDTATLGFTWSKLFMDKRLLSQLNVEYKDSRASDDLDYKGMSTKLALVYRLTDKWNIAGYISNFRQVYDYRENIGRAVDKSLKFGTKLDYQFDTDKEIYLGFGKGLRSSDIYGDISSDKVDVKLGMKMTFK